MLRSIAMLLALLAALPVQGEDDPAYLDDGSTPEMLVRSFYNAISRYEHGRAWGYLNPDFRPDYESFHLQFDDILRAEPINGFLRADGRADAIYYEMPLVVRLTDRSGQRSYESGCVGVVWPLNDLQGVEPYRMPYLNYVGMSAAGETAGSVPLPECD